MRGTLSNDTGPWGEEINYYMSGISEKIRNGEIPLGNYPEQYKGITIKPINLTKKGCFYNRAWQRQKR